MGQYSKHLTNRVMNSGPKNGYCVICGEFGSLSRDHVPPKGCDNFSDTQLRFLNPSAGSKISTSQGGTHFRSICAECNSTKLGATYDPELIKMVNDASVQISAASRKVISTPRLLNLWIKPQKVSRAIVGHVLAANASLRTAEPIPENPMDSPLKEYFLDPAVAFPSDYELHYWPYPYNDQVVAKYFSKLNIATGARLIGHSIKFAPFGFMLAYKREGYGYLNAPCLIEDKDMGLDEMRQLSVDLSVVPSKSFPEYPYDDEVMAYNSKQAFVAERKI